MRLGLVGLAIAAAFLSFWPWPGPAGAQAPGGIEVTEERSEVKFPSSFVFTLSARADQEISLVRLFFRPRGITAWSYAYPGLIPGRSVTTKLNLDIGGATYLPPGTELEYYYVLTDAVGNTSQTDVQVLEYIDQRFDWERTQVGSLQLLHHDLSGSRVESVTKEVEGALTRIRNLLNLGVSQPMRGVLYNSNSEAEAAFPRQSQTITDAQVFAGFAFPPNRAFVGVGFKTRIIAHEAAHLLFDQALGSNALPAPAWLEEGFASYVEPGSRSFSGSSLNSLGLPLRTMARVSGTPQDISVFYLKSESVVSYLIEEFGEVDFRRFVAELSQGRVVDAALANIYGFDISGLERSWSTEDQRPPAPRPGSPARGTPWTSFSGVIIGALALVLMASMVVRLVVRKLRPVYDGRERLQPWEDPDLMEWEEGEEGDSEGDRR